MPNAMVWSCPSSMGDGDSSRESTQQVLMAIQAGDIESLNRGGENASGEGV